MNNTKIILLAIIFGVIASVITSSIILNQEEQESEEELIKEFYEIENAVYVSPHSLRKSMDNGINDFILVDLRSQQEYEKEHIIGAVNIPAYKDPDTSAYGDVDRILNSFKELKASNPNKDIIAYCYSIPCMTARKIGELLADNDIYVKHLGIGWNEWRYYWTLWNHEHEWKQTNVLDYVSSGPTPGTPKLKLNSTACIINNEFGC